MSRLSFLASVPCSLAPFLHRVAWDSFPDFAGPTGESDCLLTFRLAPSWTLLRRTTRAPSSFSARDRWRGGRARGRCCRVAQPVVTWNRKALPSSQGALANVPCSPTPAGSRSPRRSGERDAVFLGLKLVDSRHFTFSGLNHTAHLLAVYASQRPLLGRHARLASGRWLAFAGRDFHPGLLRKVSGHRHFHPPCLSFLGALNLGEAFPAKSWHHAGGGVDVPVVISAHHGDQLRAV